MSLQKILPMPEQAKVVVTNTTYQRMSETRDMKVIYQLEDSRKA
jgi:hypothetical protein